MKRLAKRVALLVVSCLFSLALFEGCCTAFAWWKFGAIDVAEIERIQTGNVDAAEMTADGSGRFETCFPHPYLGSVQNEKIEDFRADLPRHLNNIGLTGRDFPLQKNPAAFTVLLTGGSVADQLATAGEGDTSYLEKFLNDAGMFDHPVVVLNGANGGWAQPQQAIMTLLYSDIADAVVTLDGYNEKGRFYGYHDRLELPSKSYEEVNPAARRGFGPLAAAWISQELRKVALRSRSRGVYFVTRAMRSSLEKTASQEQSGISTKSIFALPQEWSEERQFTFNSGQFKKYIRSIDALATLHGAKFAHFIQPCPAFDKELTPEEKRVVGAMEYRGTYQKLGDELMNLRGEGVPIVNLRDVFREESQTIYADTIHCRFEPGTDYSHAVNFTPSTGYRIMAKRIAAELSRMWHRENGHSN